MDAAPQLDPTSSQQAGSGSTEPRPARPGYKATPEQLKKLQRVQSRIDFQTRDASRWSLERQMFENIAFSCGQQWIEYSDTTKRFSRWNAPSWFPTPVSPLIGPRVQVMQAAIVRSQPVGRVRPNSSDPADREAAKTGEKIIPHIHDVADEDGMRDDASLWATLTGTVIIEDFFNPRAGKVLVVPRTKPVETPVMGPAASCAACGTTSGAENIALPCPGCGAPMAEGQEPRMWPDGSPMILFETGDVLDENQQPIVDRIPEGEIQGRVRPLFNFYWDPKATRLKEARWCGEAFYADLDWIDENFPEYGPYVAAQEGVEQLNFHESALLSLIGPSQQSATGASPQIFRNGCVVRKYQEKPSREHPKGLQLIEANGVLLFEGDLPIKDENGEVVPLFTYTEFRYDVVPGRFAGRTPVEDMVPLQKRVNGIDAQVILNRKTLLNPWILAPKGSGLNPGQIAMRPGATVLYNFVGVGAAPQVVNGVPLPEQIIQERQTAVEQIIALSQDAAAMTAENAPGGTKSGISLNFAKEAREEVTIPRLKRWGLFHAERDRKRLLLAQQHYREPRIVKLLGTGNEWQAKYFRGSDLRGNTDVTVDPGTLVARSPSIQDQKVFDAIEAQLLIVEDPVSRQRIIERLGLREFDTEIGPDVRRAEKENAQLDEGIEVEPTPVDNHEIHLFIVEQRIKDPSFDELPPEAQTAHWKHREAHQLAVQEAKAAQQKAEEEAMVRQTVLAERAKAAGVKNAGPDAVANGGDSGRKPAKAA